jgi:hypothetical protein
MATPPRIGAPGHTLHGSKLRRLIQHIRTHLDQDLTLAQLGVQGRWPWNRRLDNSHQTRWLSLNERRLNLEEQGGGAGTWQTPFP